MYNISHEAHLGSLFNNPSVFAFNAIYSDVHRQTLYARLYITQTIAPNQLNRLKRNRDNIKRNSDSLLHILRGALSQEENELDHSYSYHLSATPNHVSLKNN